MGVVGKRNNRGIGKTSMNTNSDNQAEHLSELVGFINTLLQLAEGFRDFQLDQDELVRLQSFLLMEASDGVIPGRQQGESFQNLALAGVKFIQNGKHYLQHKESYYRSLLVEQLQHNGIPLSQFPQLAKNTKDLTPADCAALKDWPEGRRLVGGASGRLENAGQFVQRLFEQKLYDEKVYGKLYLHDLRHINSKLYQALSRWQKRTGEVVVENKQTETQQLVSLGDNKVSELPFGERARIQNARWRQRHKL